MQLVKDTPIEDIIRQNLISDTNETIWVGDESSSYCEGEVYYYVKSQNFTKNDCVNGTGTSVTFVKSYFSTISIDDATSKATSDSNFANLGQKYANKYGNCTI